MKICPPATAPHIHCTPLCGVSKYYLYGHLTIISIHYKFRIIFQVKSPLESSPPKSRFLARELTVRPLSHLRFQGLDFEKGHLNIGLTTSSDHLPIQYSPRLSIQIYGILSRETTVGEFSLPEVQTQRFLVCGFQSLDFEKGKQHYTYIYITYINCVYIYIYTYVYAHTLYICQLHILYVLHICITYVHTSNTETYTQYL